MEKGTSFKRETKRAVFIRALCVNSSRAKGRELVFCIGRNMRQEKERNCWRGKKRRRTLGAILGNVLAVEEQKMRRTTESKRLLGGEREQAKMGERIGY